MRFEKEVPFSIDTDKSLLQRDVIYDYLLHEAYWSKERPREIIAKAIDHSLCFGMYTAGKQVGFARVVTDCATFAYLGDMFILTDWQGQGLGKWLIECVMAYLDGQGVPWTMLATRDARELYEEYGGFQKLYLPEKWLGRVNPLLRKDDARNGGITIV